MYVDSHVHLQPHGEAPPMTRERIEAYVDAARANGVERIAITEHLFRFQEAFDLLAGWWDIEEEDPALVKMTEGYWRDHISGSVADYVRLIEAAKSAGLPVLLGLEMDWVPGRAEDLRRFLAPYDWDIVLGSVHWIGAFGFDHLSDPLIVAEWERRDTDAIFADYSALLRDLAASGLADVLAHPDLPKIAGHPPTSVTPLHDAIIEAAREGHCAVEVNSNGYRRVMAEPYPSLNVLERAHTEGLPITLASDAHHPERVGLRFDDLTGFAAQAGYDAFVSFEGRRRASHPLPDTPRAQEGAA
jgi:histidinol-phosphatase (PHP family)